jgi:uncharacterized protein YndB with AHSA1/START domain
MPKTETKPNSYITSDEDAVVSEIVIAAPPERVFSAIADGGELMKWWRHEEHFLPSAWEMDRRVGGKWRFEGTSPNYKSAHGVTVFQGGGEILEIDPPRRLVYTWIANWHKAAAVPSVVRWELTKIEGGTLVKVTHSGLKDEAVARTDYAGGWPGVLEWLRDYAARR